MIFFVQSARKTGIFSKFPSFLKLLYEKRIRNSGLYNSLYKAKLFPATLCADYFYWNNIGAVLQQKNNFGSCF